MSTVYWGVCVPSTCTPSDVAFAIKSSTVDLIDLDVLVENDSCQVKRAAEEWKTPLWLTVLLGILAGFAASVGQGAVFCSEEIDREFSE